MFEIGASLAAARRAGGLGVCDAEQLSCMRAKYITALEDDRFDELPGRTYARAFLRTYAAALGLRADDFVAEFDAQHPEPEEAEILPMRPRRPVRLPFTVPALARSRSSRSSAGRRGFEHPPLLAQRTLAQGEAVSFEAPRVWLRLGAPWNAVVRRGTRTLRLPKAARPANVAY